MVGSMKSLWPVETNTACKCYLQMTVNMAYIIPTDLKVGFHWQEQPEMVIWQRVQHGNGHSLPDNQQQRDGDIMVALVVVELRVTFQDVQNDVNQLLLEHSPLWRRHTWGKAKDQHMQPHWMAFHVERAGGSHWPRQLPVMNIFILFFDFQFGKKKKDTKQKHSAANIMSCFKQQNKPKIFLLPAGQNKRQLSQIGNLARFWIWKISPDNRGYLPHPVWTFSMCAHCVFTVVSCTDINRNKITNNINCDGNAHTFGKSFHGPPDIQDHLVVVLMILSHISAYNRPRRLVNQIKLHTSFDFYFCFSFY